MMTLDDETSITAAIADFRSQTGAWPSPGAPNPHERELGCWLQDQRTLQATGHLDVFRRAFLDVNLPGWDTDPHERWVAGARDLADFIISEGRLPHLGSADKREQGLAAWLRMQQALFEHGTLRRDRRAWLDSCCPGWSERTGRGIGAAAHIGT